MIRRHWPASRSVHVGAGGLLFWLGARFWVLGLYRDSVANRWLTWRWRRLVLRRAARAATLGIRFLFAVAPDKLSLFGAELRGIALDPALAPGRRLRQALTGTAAEPAWIDLFAPLSLSPRELHLRTDTHWNFAGYLAAYEAICAACGAATAAHVATSPSVEIEETLDLGGHVLPPVTERYAHHHILRDAERVEANALVLYRERHAAQAFAPGVLVGSRVVYRNDGAGADPRRLLVFGDSYLFQPAGLGPMLAETFQEVHCVWSARIDWRYVREVAPDILLNEIAERFLRAVPRDAGFRVEALAAARVAAAEARRAGRPRRLNRLRRLLGRV
ncbi:MAG: hypothetical protein JO048_04845 [Methylobacteriaceae bacterium]|nr:hypothetical protein [Methylobacteriaceae bacterium]